MSFPEITMESLKPLLDLILSIHIPHGLFASTTGRRSATGLAVLGLAYATNKALGHWMSPGNAARWDWNREIVLVTGGGSGLGELTVRKLARRGVKVVAVDVRPPRDPFPPGVRFYRLDVTSPEAIREAARRMRRDVGGEPTVLVNNAGVGTGKPMLEESEVEIRRTFEVNVMAHFFMVREFLPGMVRQDHGHVVTMASTASFVTLAGNVDYACSKAAALAFHEGLGQELRYRYNAWNVCTSIIHPSFVNTPMLGVDAEKGGFAGTLLDPNDVAEAMVRQIMGGRSGQVFLPAHFTWLSGLRALPIFVQELFRGSMAYVLVKPPSA